LLPTEDFTGGKRVIDSISYKLRTMYKWPMRDKTLGFINGAIVFAFVVAVLSVGSYTSAAEFEDSHIQKAPEVSGPKKSHDSNTEPESIESALNYLLERLKDSESKTEVRTQAVEQGYILIDFETDDHGWIAAGSGQGKFEIGIPVPFSPKKGECKTVCLGTGPSEDHSAIGVNAACTNLDGHMAPLDTIYTNSLTSPIYDFSGCSNVTLELWRFMEIEGVNSDFCYYQYKNSPTGQWTTFETYGTIEVDDDNWVEYTKDLSSVADGRSHFQLRFYCTTDEWTEGSGLSLDDIKISWSRANEPQTMGERQAPVQEFEGEAQEATDTLIAEYEQEIAAIKTEAQDQKEKPKSEAEKREVKVERELSEPEQSEEHALSAEPNSINSALAALIERLEAFEPAPEVKPKVESKLVKEKARLEAEARLKTEDRLQAQGRAEFEAEAQEATDTLKTEHEQEIAEFKTKTQDQEERLKAEAEKKEAEVERELSEPEQPEKRAPSAEPNSIESALNYLHERLKDSESETEVRTQAVELGYILINFETDDHGWIAAGSGQGKFEIGIPVPFSPNKGECKTACFGTGPSEDHSAIGVNAACTNLDGYMAPLETLYTNSLTSPIYDFNGCSNVTLELWRFMEIEGVNSDFCYYQYKNSPTGQWTTFETYGSIEVNDDDWIKYTKDLSVVADGKSYFQLRFYCTTDEWTEGSGLCLDDIKISWSRTDELQITGEPQAQLPRRSEFDTEPEKMTDTLIAEYEQEIAIFNNIQI
ncbi:MAG: hypothetical protein ACYSSP_11645, partial [Planctomycetota bacterium]